jgi:glycosyltransferase involved in cell wall biosynthesis
VKRRIAAPVRQRAIAGRMASMTSTQHRTLVIASDTIAASMAGSGIRYWNLARVIGQQQPVTLATRSPVDLDPPAGVTIIPYGDDQPDEHARNQRLARLIESHDIVIAQHIPYYETDSDVLDTRYLVIDLYAPWMLEKLEYARLDPEQGEPNRADDVAILNRLLSLGDFFICASERQRDFWFGALASAGRLELAHAQRDPELRGLLDIVPFGLPDDPPVRTGPGPRRTIPGIGPEDTVILWNGGMWNWLDPLTAIRAVALLVDDMPRLRLVFMGVRSPVARVAPMGIVDEARSLANDLGLLDRHVFLNDWVPYHERQNWLLDADLALSLHLANLESRFAYRTRMLDLLWCGVPAVATTGDVLAEIVESEQIGKTAPPADPESVAAAMREALDPESQAAMRGRLARLAARHTWEQVAAPLLAYCAAPRRGGSARGTSPVDQYIHRLERTYTETANYARDLEHSIAEHRRVLDAPITGYARWKLGEIKRRLRRL